MIIASKKYAKSKKRNREYTPYEDSKEEVKNIIKRSKLINYGKYLDIG